MSLKILVVEDDHSMAELLVRCLSEISPDISAAHGFDDAMIILRIIPPPDIITLDLSLGIGGAEATIPRIHEMRDANPCAVIIVLTGAVERLDRQRILDAGADELLLKSDLLPMRGVSKGFIDNLSDAMAALVKQPFRYQKNVLILELLAERLAKAKLARSQ